MSSQVFLDYFRMTFVYVPASDTNQLQIALSNELQLDEWSEGSRMIMNPIISTATLLSGKTIILL